MVKCKTMAHGLNTILKRGSNAMGCGGNNKSDGKTGIGSRRIFAPQFKLQVLDSYRNDADCKGNQRATARKYGIHRRQIQKWLQVENNLRNSVVKSKCSSSVSDLIVSPEARKCGLEMALRSAEHRQRDDVCVEAYSRQQPQRQGQGQGQQRCSETAGDASERGYEREEETRGRSRSDAADKRVPDIPQQHNSPVAAAAIMSTASLSLHHHEWQPVQVHHTIHPLRHGSPDDTSSTLSEVEYYGIIGSPSHCSLSPRSPPFAPIPLHPHSFTHSNVPMPIHHIPTPVATGCTGVQAVCSNVSPLLPLDFTTHSRRVAPSPDSPRGATRTSPTPASPVPHSLPYELEQQSDSAAPIDLSLKKPKPYPRASPDLQAQAQAQEVQAPVPSVLVVEATVPIAPLTPPIAITNNTTVLDDHHSHTHTHSHSQIWDLSTKGIKRNHEEDDDIIDVSSVPVSESQSVTTATGNSRPIKLFKPYLDHVIEEYPNNNTVNNNNTADDIKPIIVSTIDTYQEDTVYYNNNNNNNNIKLEYPSFYKDENYHHYHPVNTEYYPNGGLHFMDNNRLSSYEEARFRSIKQRQSYSLDFKLSAIECYYSDAICRGNQRAVASKFKIHRRQVQKWLKQEDQLRQRNDTKPMHIVR